MEVSLLSRLLVPLERAWLREESWEGVGEEGGALVAGGGGLRTCPPWNVLRTVEPRDKRDDKEETPEEEEEEATPTPAARL